MAHPDGVIWKNLTFDDKYVNKRVWLFIHQTMFVSGVERKSYYDVNEFTPLRNECYLQKLCS